MIDLSDYNTELSNNDRAEIAEYIESLQIGIEGCQNMMRGMMFNININADIKAAYQRKIEELESLLNDG